MNKKNILITGCCGFIGYHLCVKLLENYNVIGLDNLNKNLYSVNIKKSNLYKLKKKKNFIFKKIDLKNARLLKDLFEKNKFNYVINLAGQAGVRSSIVDPLSHIKDNIIGFTNLATNCYEKKIKLIFASSSSVYNDNINKIPFVESETEIKPKTIYGFTKYTNELISNIFNKQFKLQFVGLRFFTVYGEENRRDMAMYKFIDSIYNNKELLLYNKGRYKRDFTYIGDIIQIIDKIIKSKKCWNEVYNIGANNTISTISLVKKIEKNLGLKAKIKFADSGIEEPLITKSNKSKLEGKIGKISFTNIDEGLNKTIEWYIKKNK